MSEAPDKRKEELAANAAALHDYNEFLNRKEWRELVADGQEAVDSLQRELLAPMKSLDDAIAKNFVIGKITGMLATSINAETKRQLLQDAHDTIVKEISDAK